MTDTAVCILLQPPKGAALAQLPELRCNLDYKPAAAHREQEPGRWAWINVPVTAGRHALVAKLAPAEDGKAWEGKASVWVVGRQKRAGVPVSVTAARPVTDRPLPPRPWPAGERRRSQPVGVAEVAVAGK
jgi:hypothetical protein